jgi:hypothetical protein
MENDKLETLLIDYIDGKLSSEQRIIVETELKNPRVKKQYDQLKELMDVMRSSRGVEPSGNLRKGFERMLQDELNTAKGRTVHMRAWIYRVAAAVAFIVVAVGAGFWINKQQRQADALEAMRQEMQATKKLMMAMLDNQQSASQRLMGATVAYNDVESLDADVVKALIHAMNKDENTNVRLAALEALAKFQNQPHVKAALIASLNTQKDPVVQIALIRMMVEMKVQGTKEKLERITTDEEALPAVKDEAHAGILRLS